MKPGAQCRRDRVSLGNRVRGRVRQAQWAARGADAGFGELRRRYFL